MAKTTGLVLGGSLNKAGLTFYQRYGKTIMRVARSNERRSNTRGQFVQRQRMRHTTALWKEIKYCQPMFCGGKSAYARFATLANRLPAVFVPNIGTLSGASFLMAEIPVSDGNLRPVKQHLGEIPLSPADSSPNPGEQQSAAALITDIKASEVRKQECLLLYTAEQRIEGGTPRIRFKQVREMGDDDFTVVDGHLALTGEEFADEMKGWALVRVVGDRCSTQSIVTRCHYYEQFTTEEALLAAAQSYGGLTE